MIDYETYCKIHDCHGRQKLTIAQTARSLGLHRETVATWLKHAQFCPRLPVHRASRLDPFKARIVRLLETHPYSAQQIFQRLAAHFAERDRCFRQSVTDAEMLHG